MDRKEFLENFLRCVDTGASTLDFRRYCRIKAQHLPRHMRQIGAYRAELARLQAAEAPVVEEPTEEVVYEVTSTDDVDVCDVCDGDHDTDDCDWEDQDYEDEVADDEPYEDDTL